MGKNLRKILRKTSDYFTGLGDNSIYDSSTRVFNTFCPKDIAKMHTQEIRLYKIIKIAAKNLINLSELSIIGLTLTPNFDYSTTLPILGLFEFQRYSLHRLNQVTQEKILKQKKAILEKELQTPQSYEDIRDNYNFKKNKRLETFGNWPDGDNNDSEDIEGEEWKH